jgi:Tfp pilus assembly protein PilF
MKLLKALLLLLGLAGAAPAQNEILPPEQLKRIRRGVTDLYNMEYARAEGAFEQMVRESPEDPAGYAYLAMTYWIQELAGKQELSIDRFASSDFFVESPKYRVQVDPALEQKFRDASHKTIETADPRIERDPNDRGARFLRGLAYQNLASFDATLKRNWLSAVRWGARTFDDYRELLRQDPEFHDAKLAIGVRDYVAGSLPWKVKWFAFLIGYHGDRERGRRNIEAAAQKARLVADDAKLILILIHTREGNYAKATQYLTELHRKYPQNYLLDLDRGGMALLMKQPDQAVAIYQGILKKSQAGAPKYKEIEPAFLYNRLGVAFRQKSDLPRAAELFRRALNGSGAAPRSRIISRLELAKTLDLQGLRQDAVEFYRAVASADDVAGSKEEAMRFLRRPFQH